MKKSLCLLMALVMCLGLLAACTSAAQPTAEAAPATQTVTAEATEAPAQEPAATDAPAADTRTVVDLAGRKVTIPQNVTKLASLCGPSFETVIMLGGVDQVVITGNGSAKKGWAPVVCPGYADLPVTEDATAPNVEELISLGVEVVLYWDAYPDVIQALEDAGMVVVVTQLDNDGIDTAQEFIDLKKKEITLVGDVLGGDAVSEAQQWCAYVDEVCANVTDVTGKLSAQELPTVYYVRGPEALKIHGGESYTRYLVDLAGGDLVSKNDAQLLYTTTMEQVIEWDPAYIFMGRVNNIELITEDPAWAPIKAVKDGHVYVNLKGVMAPDYSTDCFLLMEQIAKTIHPDLFADLDLVAEVQNYFKTFYEYELTEEQANRVLSFQDPA